MGSFGKVPRERREGWDDLYSGVSEGEASTEDNSSHNYPEAGPSLVSRKEANVLCLGRQQPGCESSDGALRGSEVIDLDSQVEAGMWSLIVGRRHRRPGEVLKLSRRDFFGGSVFKTPAPNSRGTELDPWSGNQIPHPATKNPACHNWDPVQPRKYFKMLKLSKQQMTRMLAVGMEISGGGVWDIFWWG